MISGPFLYSITGPVLMFANHNRVTIVHGSTFIEFFEKTPKKLANKTLKESLQEACQGVTFPPLKLFLLFSKLPNIANLTNKLQTTVERL